jgi:hypothetical protein
MGGAAGGAGGFIAGAAGGAAGSAVSSPIQSFGNSLYFGDPLLTPKQWAMGVGIGTLLGGVTNGSIALFNGRNFWNGNLPTPTPTYIDPLPTRGHTKIGGDAPYYKGQEGLKINNIQQNTTRIESLTNTAHYRVPDEMMTRNNVITQIGEVKHYSVGRTVQYTNQLKDFIQYAEINRIPFQLYVPNGVNISAPLQNAVNQSSFTIIVRY